MDNLHLPPEPSDAALVAQIVQRDIVAFSIIYDRYARAVFVLAAHMLGRAEAEDVVQEVFLRLWNKAKQFDNKQGSFSSWFMSIARHHVLDELRRRSQHQRVVAAEEIDALLAQAVDPEADVEGQVWMNHRAAIVLDALKNLPDEQRRVIVLAYFGGLTQSAIAQQLGWPLGTVKKRVRLGLQKLKAALAQEGMTIEAPTGSKR